MLFYYFISPTRPNSKFPLYLKKVGLAKLNVVHRQKKTFYAVSVSAFVFFEIYRFQKKKLHRNET